MVEFVTLVVVVIFAIGLLVVGIPILSLAIWFWWFTIPALGAWIGGWVGFVFGVGLDVVIGIVYVVIRQAIEDIRDAGKSRAVERPALSSHAAPAQESCELFCTSCGSQLVASARFCTICGEARAEPEAT